MDETVARRRINPVERKNELKKEIAECQKSFLRTIIQITNKLHNKNKRDGDLAELKERISVAVRDAPEDIFQNAGEYVWKYREEIRLGEIKKFLKMDFKDEVEHKVTDSSEVEQVQQLITKIKHTWRLLNENEQKDLTKDVQKLVAKYAQWEAHTRELKSFDEKK